MSILLQILPLAQSAKMSSTGGKGCESSVLFVETESCEMYSN